MQTEKEFGEYLAQLRAERGWSIREAARRTGLSHTYLANLEAGVDPRSGKPISVTVSTIQSLSRGYGVPERIIAERAGLKLGNDPADDDLNERLLRVLESLASSLQGREETERQRIELERMRVERVEAVRAEAEYHREESLQRLIGLLESGERLRMEPRSRAPDGGEAAVAGGGGQGR